MYSVERFFICLLGENLVDFSTLRRFQKRPVRRLVGNSDMLRILLKFIA